MKPLVRWTIGKPDFHGLEVLRHSVRSFQRIYGDRFDYVLCYNNVSPDKLDLNIDLYEQSAVHGMPEPTGVAWKLYPPRLVPDRHEIFIDNDLLICRPIEEIEWFLETDSRFFITEGLFGLYGQFSGRVEGKLNSGLFGFPPNFDLGPYLKGVSSWSSKFDEQGLVSLAVTSHDWQMISLDKIGICNGYLARGSCGLHFVELNAGSVGPWKQYVKTRLL